MEWFFRNSYSSVDPTTVSGIVFFNGNPDSGNNYWIYSCFHAWDDVQQASNSYYSHIMLCPKEG
jgi:hypothetical protein